MNASCHLNPNKGIRAGQPALSRGLYTNVTECGCFSVYADKLFKVLGMSCDSAFVRSANTPTFVAHFVSDALSANSPTNTKAGECKAFFFLSFSGLWVIVASFLSAAKRDAIMQQQAGETLLWR